MVELINGECMTLTVDYQVVATAGFSQHAAADGTGAWIVSTHPPGSVHPRLAVVC
jgi:hypothetical protein